MLTARDTDDEGSVMLLVIAYTALAAVLIVVGVDVSKVFLAQRALDGAADSAALAAAQGVDTAAIDGGTGPTCGTTLPLDPQRAAGLGAVSLDTDSSGLAHTFVSLDPPVTRTANSTVEVTMSGEVAVPFGGVIGWLDPGRGPLVRVTATSYAQSPVAGTC